MANVLKIKQNVIDKIIAHAKQDAPIEACGYLADKDGIIVKHFQLTNTDASKEQFSLDPREQFAAIRKMREEGLSVCAVYHSHPVSPARPSEEDIKLAYDPNLSYVIISLADGLENIRSFRIRKGEVSEEKVEVIVG